MALRFTIENFPNLPDGGPISFTVTGKRSVDIGRDPHLDWTLPDPTRFISGKHCEVHYRNNGYWLHDVSTNGTYLNGSDQRMRSPYELKNGDRLVIGQYVVAVALDSGPGATADRGMADTGNSLPQHAAYPELWTGDSDVAPPVDRRQMMAQRQPAAVNPDFLDWAAAVPAVDQGSIHHRRAAAPPPMPSDGYDWASGPATPVPAPPEPAPIATPRRPVWKDDSAEADPRQAAPASPAPPPDIAPRRPAAPPPVAEPAAPPRAGIVDDGFMQAIARSANLPENFFAGKDPQQLAEQLGVLMRITVSNLMQLLQARNEAKRLARSTSQTTIQATENNPLKFSPTPEDAMRILFGPKTHSYLEARRAFEQGFDDLKTHQLKTYMAMQHAVTMLIAGVDPAEIERQLGPDEGVLDKMRSRKSRLWDAFMMRWKTGLGRESGAVVEAFMLHFADAYDRDGRK